MRRRRLLTTLAATALAGPALAQSSRPSTLRYVPASNLPNFDPMFASEVLMFYGYYVFDTLYATNAQGKLRPQMAEGHTVSDDGRTWRIRLRDGLWFHDGSPVRAVDCAASLSRWSQMDTFGQLLAKVVDRWGTADDRTIEIQLTRPFPLLLDAIGKSQSRVAFMMPERSARTDPFKPISDPVGSGPYRFQLDEFVSGSRAIFTRFDRYVPRQDAYDGPAGGKVAYFPRIEWQIVPDAATAAAALLAGEVDWLEQPQPDLYGTLKASRDIVLQVDNPEGRAAFMRMNHLQPPFDDVLVRRAVLAAVNQDDTMQSVMGDDPTLYRSCRSQFPCGTPYEVDDDGAFMPGSLERGRQLLRQAGYAGQKTVLLNPTDNAMVGPLGMVMADLMKRLGMNVELASSDWATIVQRRSSREPVEKGGWSALHSYGGSSLYANPVTNPMLRGIGLKGWPGWWTNDRAEELVQAWLDAPTEPRRVELGQQLGRLAMEQVAIVPVGQWVGRTAFRKRIVGVTPGGAPYPWNVRPA